MAMNNALAVILILNSHLMVGQSGPNLPDDFNKSIEVDSETGSSKEVISSENEPQSVPEGNGSQPTHSQPDATTAVRLFVSSSESCIPCRQLWAAVERGDLEGFEVVESQDFEGLAGYPAIRFKHASSKTGWAVRYGWSAGQLGWLRSNLLPTIKQGLTVRSMSHSEMKSLHNSLHGPGEWSWPGDLAEHLRTTHGVPIHGVDQNYRESAVLSSRVSVRSAVHGSRFVGRSRNSYRVACPPGRKS